MDGKKASLFLQKKGICQNPKSGMDFAYGIMRPSNQEGNLDPGEKCK